MTTDHQSTQSVKSLPTRYAGCHFRSRLEARWAVFFDALKIEWQYEPEGFIGCHGLPYLPDFYLPDTHVATHEGGTYVEVKGTDDALRADSDKIGGAIDWAVSPLSSRGLIILGDVPRPPEWGEIVLHSFLYHRKGVEHVCGMFEERYPGNRYTFSNASAYTPPWFDDNTSEAVPNRATTQARTLTVQYRQGAETRGYQMDRAVVDAYTAARSARFEHGQSGPT